MILAIAVKSALECWQLDYTAFLNAKVEEKVYIKMTPRYEEFDEAWQSPRCWYDTVDEHVVKIVLKGLRLDASIYIYSGHGAIYIMTPYGDDVLLSVNDCKVLEHIYKRKLMGPSL